MKGKFFTWDEFKELLPSQTAIILTYSSPSYKGLPSPWTRVLVGDFPSREEAWSWCKQEGIRRMVYYKESEPIQVEVKLLKLGKLIREYSESHPKRVSALKVR